MKATRKLAISLFMASLLLSACSSPAPTPTEAAPESSAPTGGATATSKVTEQPAATATPSTEASLQLEIVDSHAWTDELGNFQIDALVRNPYDFPVSEFNSYVTFFDSAGNVLMDSVYFEILDGDFGQILPGETVPAVNCAYCSLLTEPDWDSFEIFIGVEQSPPISYSTDVEVVVDRFTSLGGDLFELGATIENTGDQTLHSVHVGVIVHDQDGNFVGTGEAIIYTPEGASGIEPGIPMYFLANIHASLTGEPVFDFIVKGR
jgi:hypothetical protein